MEKHPGKRGFGGPKKFGGQKKFGGPKKFGGAGSFRKGPAGPRKFGGPKPEDGVKPEGRVGGAWRAPGIASPSSPTKSRGDFRAPRPSYGERGPRPEGAGYSPRPYTPRTYGADRPAGGSYAPRAEGAGYAPRPFSRGPREGYSSAPRPYSPRPEGAGYAPRAARPYGDRPAPFNREDRGGDRPYTPRPSYGAPRPAGGGYKAYTPRPYTDRPAPRFERRDDAPRFNRDDRGPRPEFRRDDRQVSSKAPEKTSWGVSAEWYDGAVEAEGSYQKELILPNMLRLMAVEKDEKIADIACGQGFFARELAKAGAKVTGVDISPELIEIAAARGEGAATFAVASAKETGLAKSGFDQAIMVLALQNIREMAETLAEAARILKKGGALHLVLNHPCFRIPKKSSWGFDSEANVQFRRLDAYLSDAAVRMEMHPGAAPEIATASFHRPLQAYFKALDKAGFSVSRLEEWSSHKTSQPGARAEAENVARREFPLFMYVRAEKR